MDLSKQQAFDVDSKAIHQISFIGNLARDLIANTSVLLIIEEAKETVLDFPQEAVRLL